jgi:hypothetical protein
MRHAYLHPCTWTDDQLVRLPSLSVPPDDPDPLYWRLGGIVWVVGTHLGGGVVVRGPARADDPLRE